MTLLTCIPNRVTSFAPKVGQMAPNGTNPVVPIWSQSDPFPPNLTALVPYIYSRMHVSAVKWDKINKMKTGIEHLTTG